MKSALALLLVLSMTLPALAQGTGKIRGTITDCDTDKPISGVALVVQDSTVSLKAKTDASGQFAFLSVPEGEYVLLATHKDYDDMKVQAIKVVAKYTSRVDFRMQKKAPQVSVAVPEE